MQTIGPELSEVCCISQLKSVLSTVMSFTMAQDPRNLPIEHDSLVSALAGSLAAQP